MINDLCAPSSKRMFALQYVYCAPTVAIAVLKRVTVWLEVDKAVVVEGSSWWEVVTFS